MTQPDWDDDRLDAAFHARFDRPAPTDLAKDVHVRIAGTSPARLALPRLGRTWMAAAAAVVVIAVTGTALFGVGGLGRSGGPPLASDGSTAEPGPSATPTEQALPGSVFGLPIIGVRDLIAIRDGGPDDDSELAVRGWFTPAPPTNCGPLPPGPVSLVQVRCPDDLVWLTEDPESLYVMNRAGVETRAPNGFALHPLLDGLQADWYPTLPDGGSGNASTPADVVFVGHFGDRRARECQDAEIPACRDRFVVDSVAFVGGVEQPISRLRMTEGALSPDVDIAAIVANEAPDSPILSTTVVDTDGLARLEPSLGPMVQGIVNHPRLWIVRVLESQRVSTYIVIDGTDAIYEMNPENEAILVGGEPPTFEATGEPTAWPPAGSRVVALTSEVGAGAPPVRVAVVDHSGRLEEAAEKGAVDPSAMPIDARFGAYAEPGIQGRVHLTWVGGICDKEITVTISKDIDSISFDLGPQGDCDSMGVGRQLVLDFAGTVDVAAIAFGEATNGPGPTVDCGPLEPDKCESRTAAIVAATPAQRIVAIAFTDACGSHQTTFADGTAVGADVDCIAGPEPSPTVDCGPLAPERCRDAADLYVGEANAKTSKVHVVAISFFDACGSYRIELSDGTSTFGYVDCFLSPAPS